MSLLQILDQQQTLARQDAHNAVNNATQLVTEAAAKAAQDSFLCRLDGYISRCWDAAKSAKEQNVEPGMLDDLRQREGVYATDKLMQIREHGGSEIFMQLTNSKCRSFESWIHDFLFHPGERPYAAEPTPVPDIPEDVKQQGYAFAMQELSEAMAMGIYPTEEQAYNRAREIYDDLKKRVMEDAELKASRMEDAIDDLLREGGWYEAMEDLIKDLAALPAAFIKGPVMQRKKQLRWQTDPMTGKSSAIAQITILPTWYSPSPLDMYPAPDSKAVNDGYLIERIPLRRSALYDMIGVPGYDEARIRVALDEYQHSGFKLTVSGDQERKELENKRNWETTPDHAIDGLEFHGKARGEWLLEWGMPAAQIPDPDADYEITALRIGRHTVRCVLNHDPLDRRPYDKCSFDSIKGQFWGRGLPRTIKDVQDLCNAAARSLVNNMGMSSGPLAEVETDRLAEGEDITALAPWRIIQTKASLSTPAPAVRYTIIPSVADKLMAVYQYGATLAGEYSGVPSYEQGINPTRGAAGTASGMSMLMAAGSRNIKRVVAGIDEGPITGTVRRAHTHLMLYVDNPDIKGDCNLVARGASSLVAKEQQQIRRMELLQVTMNPVDLSIMKETGRAEMLREAFKANDIPYNRVIPSNEEMLQQQAQQLAQMAMQGQIGPDGRPMQQQPQATLPNGAPAGANNRAAIE